MEKWHLQDLHQSIFSNELWESNLQMPLTLENRAWENVQVQEDGFQF